MVWDRRPAKSLGWDVNGRGFRSISISVSIVTLDNDKQRAEQGVFLFMCMCVFLEDFVFQRIEILRCPSTACMKTVRVFSMKGGMSRLSSFSHLSSHASWC